MKTNKSGHHKDTSHPMPPELCITGIGLASSVGHDHKTACASMRAEINRPTKLNNFYSESKEGYEDPFDGLVTGHPALTGNFNEQMGRMFFLLSMALIDLFGGFHDMNTWEGAFFCLALPCPGRLTLSEEAMYHLIPEHVRTVFPMDMCRFYPNGHAGMVMAVHDMAAAFGKDTANRAVIAGTDSLIGIDDLTRFENQHRLKTHTNPEGLIPGEAASAIVVETRSSIKKRNADIRAVIKNVSVMMDENHVLSGNPPEGSSLAEAVKTILTRENIRELSVDAVINDLNGESYRFEEWAMVQARLNGTITGEKNLICPARFIGDTGAASPGAAIAMAVRGMERHYLTETDEPKGKALILASSDTGERGVLLIQNVHNEEDP